MLRCLIKRRDNFSLNDTRKALKVASPFGVYQTQYEDSLLTRTETIHSKHAPKVAQASEHVARDVT